MADKKLLAILRQGADAWNEWREENPKKKVDLSGANLSGAELIEAELSVARTSAGPGIHRSGKAKCAN